MLPQNRRAFIKRLAGTAAATAAIPPARLCATRERHDIRSLEQSLKLVDAADESYWQMVKEQFPLRPGLTIMNAANLCPSPYAVVDSVSSLTRDVDADASFQNRSKFAELRERTRTGLASLLGADPGEIAITRNTSEGNNAVINGLTLGAGDEVIVWNQNHPTNNVAWDVRAERYGYAVRRVATPLEFETDEELVRPFSDAFSSNTKVLAFSHVSNVSGIALPARKLCALARERGVLTLVDGAQTFGAVRVDLHEIGCDFYTGSSHKWLMGPKEAGVLFVRAEQTENLWPSDVGVGWANALEHGAQKFENLGQRDDAAVAAMGTAVKFQETLGKDRIAERVRFLASSMRDGVARTIPRALFFTPESETHRAGVVVFAVPDVDPRTVFERLYREHQIACAAMGGDFAGIRFSPHVYNTMEDINRVLAVLPTLV